MGFLAGIFLKQNVSGSQEFQSLGIRSQGRVAGGTKRHTDAEACPDDGIQNTVIKRCNSLRSDPGKPIF